MISWDSSWLFFGFFCFFGVGIVSQNNNSRKLGLSTVLDLDKFQKLVQKMYSTFTTRNRQLAEKLTKKLDGSLTQSNDLIYRQQLYQHRTMDNKYKQCVQKLKIYKTKNQRYQHQIHQDIQNIEDVLYTLQRNKNRIIEIPNHIFEGFDKLVQGEQASNTEKMNLVRKGMIEDIDKKKKTMKTDAIEIIEQEFEQFCKTNLTDIEKKVSIIVNMLEQQRMNREESAAQLAQNIGQQILKMQHMIGQQRQQRKKQNQILLDLIGDVEDKLDRQISQEINLREKCESQMEGIVEQLCTKIGNKILGD